MKRKPCYKRRAAKVLTTVFAAGLVACTKDQSPPLPAKPASQLPAVVSFSTHILPLFNTYCNTAGCHSASNPAANLDLSAGNAYSQLFAKHEVDTVNVDASVLYIQMNSTSNPMPVTGRLSDYDVELVHRWIQQKARNN